MKLNKGQIIKVYFTGGEYEYLTVSADCSLEDFLQNIENGYKMTVTGYRVFKTGGEFISREGRN